MMWRDPGAQRYDSPGGRIAMSPSWKTVRVAAKTKEADDITSFELVDPQGGLLQPFSAGSHIDVEIVPGIIRQYSLCNDPRERDRYLIGVLREPTSRGGSTTLIDSIATGAVVRIGEPRNHFALDPTAKRVLLLAGGIGITPILCMAEQLVHTGTPFELHYCARTRGRAAFHDRIQASAFAHRAHFHFGENLDTRLDIARVLGRSEPDDHLYVCGPKGFIESVLTTASSAGWRAEQLHREFFTPTEDTDRSLDGAFEVMVASTGEQFRVEAGQTIIEVLSANGFDIPVSCEQGVCGTCLTRVLEGVPDHRDMFMTDDEHARNDQFTPCCSRAKSGVLVLDL
jgi:vanillate O-demethylase ferredoxin subunit